MKPLIFFLALSAAIFGAQAPIYITSPAAEPTPSAANAKKQVPNLPATHQSANETVTKTMTISPELRAKDLQSALKFLNQHVPASKPHIILRDGSKITGIIDIDIMPGGTILIFKIASLKGTHYRVVNIEEVQSLSE